MTHPFFVREATRPDASAISALLRCAFEEFEALLYAGGILLNSPARLRRNCPHRRSACMGCRARIGNHRNGRSHLCGRFPHGTRHGSPSGSARSWSGKEIVAPRGELCPAERVQTTFSVHYAVPDTSDSFVSVIRVQLYRGDNPHGTELLPMTKVLDTDTDNEASQS
jgi:hypothetical protein